MKKSFTFKEIDNIVRAEFLHYEFEGVSFMENKLSQLLGVKVCCYDLDIDNGCDEDNEDDYVMYASFQLENYNINITFYYGDKTNDIEYIDVREF